MYKIANAKSMILGLAALLTTMGTASVNADEKSRDYYFSGTVEISSTQIAFIASAQTGTGTLEYDGKEYEFTIGGLGVGGIGISTMNAVGVVYNLNNLEDFNGAYLQGRVGATVGSGKNTLDISNTKGVIMQLKGSSEGLALSLGADGLSVKLK